jgi:hypothetical protein
VGHNSGQQPKRISAGGSNPEPRSPTWRRIDSRPRSGARWLAGWPRALGSSSGSRAAPSPSRVLQQRRKRRSTSASSTARPPSEWTSTKCAGPASSDACSARAKQMSVRDRSVPSEVVRSESDGRPCEDARLSGDERRGTTSGVPLRHCADSSKGGSRWGDRVTRGGRTIAAARGRQAGCAAKTGPSVRLASATTSRSCTSGMVIARPSMPASVKAAACSATRPGRRPSPSR